MSKAVPPPNIPVVQSFKYLGISFFPSLQATASHNFNSVLGQVEADLNRWAAMPNTFQARISVIKMNILPQVNFCSYMLPLPSPTGYWDKLHKLVTHYVWNGKRPRIKMSILQRTKSSGGLGLPNFKFYSWSFTLRALFIWINSDARVAWRPSEEKLVGPHRLQHIIYSNVPLKTCRSQYGLIISHLMATWRYVEKHANISLKYHPYFPLYNFALCLANQFISPNGGKKGLIFCLILFLIIY